MLSRARSVLCVSLLIGSLGYAVFAHGGDRQTDSNLSLALLGAAALLGRSWLFPSTSARPTRSIDRVLDRIALLFPVYVGFQLVPLPLSLVRILSPARFEIASALRGVMDAPHFATLSIAPPTTWVHLSRITGYALTFLLVRELARRFMRGPWAPAMPLIVIGAIEAAWALGQALAGADVWGSYYNKNHLAGLLEMTLPFAVMYGITVLYRGKARADFATSAVAKACAVFAGAFAIFLAIILSLSKMGILSTLGSLCLMAILGLSGRLSGWRRWSAALSLVLAAMFVLIFLIPPEAVLQFGDVAVNQHTEGRLPLMKDALRLIAAYPLFGSGLGTFFPGLLRYQTFEPGYAWVHTHNDYLQLLSELGFVGWLMPAVLMGAVLALAAWVGLHGPTRETRFLGLACAGGLTAILIHSFGDFNTYVLANAMTLCWIAGLSAALPSFDVTRPDLPRGSGRTSTLARSSTFRIRDVVTALGCALGIYTVAWLIFLHFFSADRSAERIFCRFGICNSNVADSGGTADSVPPIPDLLEFLKRDPAGPYGWEDLGVAMQTAGRIDTARYCFSRALTLAPKSPSTLLMAADFHFDLGEKTQALKLISRILETGSVIEDQAVFAVIQYRKIPVEEALQALSLGPRSSRFYLNQLMTQETPDFEGAARLWSWIVSNGYADNLLASQYVEFLLERSRPESAVRAWASYAGSRADGYPEANRLFNGDFESDPTGNRLDWKLDSRAAAIDFDRDVKYSGARSLRIQFDGTLNPSAIGVRQEVFLQAGRYRFRVYVRTASLSTDQGVAFRIVYDDEPGQLDITTDNLRGTNDWTLVERVFEAPRGGGLVSVNVLRKASLKFDNLIRGTAWIDQLSIRKDGS